MNSWSGVVGVKQVGRINEETALTLEGMACSGKLWDSRTIGWGKGSTEEVKGKTREGRCQIIKGI